MLFFLFDTTGGDGAVVDEGRGEDFFYNQTGPGMFWVFLEVQKL